MNSVENRKLSYLRAFNAHSRNGRGFLSSIIAAFPIFGTTQLKFTAVCVYVRMFIDYFILNKVDLI